MMNNSYEESLSKQSDAIGRLGKEIQNQNQKFIDLEHKHVEKAVVMSKLIAELAENINSRQKTLLEMDHKYNESVNMTMMLMDEGDTLHEVSHREHEQISKEHKESKVLNDLLHKNFTESLQKYTIRLRTWPSIGRLVQSYPPNATQISSLQVAAMKQIDDCKNALKLVEDLKRQKGNIYAKIIRIEKQLDVKQKLGLLDIEKLKGSIIELKYQSYDEDAEVLKVIDDLKKDLRDKEQPLQDLNALNQTRIIKERKSNNKLWEARKELVEGLKGLSSHGNVRLKRMGELGTRPFLEGMKKNYNEEAEKRASELCSLWEEYLKDPDWHPFKVIRVEGKEKLCLR
ncbi:hypothetical protein VNO77_43643 [Canavalia gladiata]|uniref:Factor of DNA methylation 1-5/IDN2 domain-containing protein n=1 Tax=Canavalia gladiata TaxID=3824 RepID=A0AAN9PQ80_CANGL